MDPRNAESYHKNKTLKRVDTGEDNKRNTINAKHKKFIKYYLETFNERRAAELAGFDPPWGRQLMMNPLITDKINMGITALLKKYEVDEESILKEIRSVAFEKNPVEKGIRWSDKLKALQMLGTTIGLFKDKEDSQTISPPNITIRIDGDKPEQSNIELDGNIINEGARGMASKSSH